MKKNDSVYPIVWQGFEELTPEVDEYGILTRDWLAAQALPIAYKMAVRLNNYHAEHEHDKDRAGVDSVAEFAYLLADAMIEQSKK